MRILLAPLIAFSFSLTHAERPNIVMIMADDLGFADLGCYGSEIETPNLDALAQEGLRFTQFYNTAKCHSSRVSLLTGMYCDQAGGAQLSRGATFAEHLGDHYHTMMVGKWHLTQQPTDFGFNRYWGHLSGATNFFTGDDSFRLDGQHWAVPATHKGKPFYTTNVIVDYALDFLDERPKDKPFLLYAAFNAPHYPLHAPESDVKKYKGHYAKGWDALRKRRHEKQIATGLLPDKWKCAPRAAHIPAWDSLSKEDKQWEEDRMEVYAAMVEILDRNIGRLIARLKAEGLYENTAIFFCSDNGACPFDRTRRKDLKPWDPKSYWCYDVGWASLGNVPFRLYKQNQHEGGIASPMIAKLHSSYPYKKAEGDPTRKKTPLGTITDQPAHLIDILPTVLDFSGIEEQEKIGARTLDPIEGKSLALILQGSRSAPHKPLYFNFGTDRALRSGDWKLVSAKLGRWELYNLAEDRTELNDLAKDHPNRVQKMAAKWHQIAKNKDRLKERQLKPVKEILTPQKFGKRKDPEVKKKK